MQTDGRGSPSLDPQLSIPDPSAAAPGMTRATCQRSSRMARPAEPSAAVQQRVEAVVHEAEKSMRSAGMERVTDDDCKFKTKTAPSSTSKGPAVRADEASEETEQPIVNHVVSVKAKNVHSGGREACWLLGTNTVVPQMYTRLAQSAFKANAVNSAVFKREQKQGASNQVRPGPRPCTGAR